MRVIRVTARAVLASKRMEANRKKLTAKEKERERERERGWEQETERDGETPRVGERRPRRIIGGGLWREMLKRGYLPAVAARFPFDKPPLPQVIGCDLRP